MDQGGTQLYTSQGAPGRRGQGNSHHDLAKKSGIYMGFTLDLYGIYISIYMGFEWHFMAANGILTGFDGDE